MAQAVVAIFGGGRREMFLDTAAIIFTCIVAGGTMALLPVSPLMILQLRSWECTELQQT